MQRRPSLAFAELNTSLEVVSLTEAIVDRAMAVAEARALRGYDAVQLAAALQVNAIYIGNGLPPLTFVSADNDLNTVAAAEGLAVENPNAHP